MDLCPDCQRIASGSWPSRERLSFPHLSLVLSDERDDLCSQSVWACLTCRSLWRESDNDYGPGGAQLGLAWDPQTLADFLRAQRELLPYTYPGDAPSFWTWFEAEGRAFSIGALGGGWA